jgi:hypothetical protein
MVAAGGAIGWVASATMVSAADGHVFGDDSSDLNMIALDNTVRLVYRASGRNSGIKSRMSAYPAFFCV